jgi:hypothetical protein
VFEQRTQVRQQRRDNGRIRVVGGHQQRRERLSAQPARDERRLLLTQLDAVVDAHRRTRQGIEPD